jgi:transposase
LTGLAGGSPLSTVPADDLAVLAGDRLTLRRANMKQYVALDRSLKQISVCVMTEQRRIVTQAVIAADAGSIVEFVRSHAPEAEVIGLESGPTSPWLFHALRAEGLPVVVIDARHAKAVLSLRINKTDRNDAVGLAELLVSGWYKPVTVKSLESHRIRTVLTNRALLVGIRQDLENQVRSVLKTFGFVLGKGRGTFVDRVSELLEGKRLLLRLVRPLLRAWEAIRGQLQTVDKEALTIAAKDETCRRLMTVPGVGAITALAFKTTIDTPWRFSSSSKVGAYLGLTPRRYASGETDRAGRISKCGDGLVRTYLVEAAGVLMTRSKAQSDLKDWGVRLAKRASPAKARVAVARKLAVILLRIWTDNSVFRPQGAAIAS